MALEVTLNKRNAFVFLGLVVLIAGLFIATAYDSNPGAPPTFGHTVNEIGPGTRAGFGGSSTFGGVAADWYAFPGHLGIGPNSIDTSAGRNLYIKDTDSGAGIGIESTGTGDTYIDFLQSGVVKSNINYKSDRLQINAHSGATNTDTVIFGRNVGIGMNPIGYKLEVAGRVKANDFCIGTNNCFSSWSGGSGGVSNNQAPTLVSNYILNALSMCGTASGGTVRVGNPSHATFVKADFDVPNYWLTLNIRPMGGTWMTLSQIHLGNIANTGTISGIVPANWEYCLSSSNYLGDRLSNFYEFVLS